MKCLNLSARGLGEPERPLVGEGVDDIEVILVVEHGNQLVRPIGLVLTLVVGVVVATRGDGDGLEVDLLRHGHVDSGVSWRGI